MSYIVTDAGTQIYRGNDLERALRCAGVRDACYKPEFRSNVTVEVTSTVTIDIDALAAKYGSL